MSSFIRQFHRWTSLVFMLIVAGLFAALGLGRQPAEWVFFVPLVPLFLLMLTGLYMFVLPYTRRKAT